LEDEFDQINGRVNLLTAFVLVSVVGQGVEFHFEFPPVANEDDQLLVVDEVKELSAECKDQRTDPHETRDEFVHVLFVLQFEAHLEEEKDHRPAHDEKGEECDQIVTSDRQAALFFLV